MSGIDIEPVSRRRLQPMKYARNGSLVTAEFQGEMARTLNQVARHMTPMSFRSTGRVTQALTAANWRFAGNISPVAGKMVARIKMGTATQSTQTNNPRIQLALYDQSGNLLKSGTAFYGYGYGRSPVDAPIEMGVATIAIDVSDIQDSKFRAQLVASQEAKAISCVVYQYAMPPDEDTYVRQQYSVGAPILDEDRSSLINLAHAIYKRGLGPVFCYSSNDDDSEALNIGGTAYQNIFSPHFGVGLDHPAAFTADLRYCNRRTKTTTPVVLECYAGFGGGSGTGDVRVRDEAGNVYATFSISGSPAWQTQQTANLPADFRRYIVEHRTDGVNTLSTFAVSVYRYDST